MMAPCSIRSSRLAESSVVAFGVPINTAILFTSPSTVPSIYITFVMTEYNCGSKQHWIVDVWFVYTSCTSLSNHPTTDRMAACNFSNGAYICGVSNLDAMLPANRCRSISHIQGSHEPVRSPRTRVKNGTLICVANYRRVRSFFHTVDHPSLSARSVCLGARAFSVFLLRMRLWPEHPLVCLHKLYELVESSDYRPHGRL
ncbi:hypothetical protein Tcan_00359 [Toxocara canis]|uniref:Uncharacterized protein n=1 Tax=Toxocara canis TaxID=6265 RepID=A0A0B2V2D5_TOXCA|nr:hypothetical protein Tcan_00359 [Toxocara canis]